ncbi:UNVERIFIED_CONTAM: hypothetical protein Sangu_2604600 [Sesamum angustifolium]|uniref:Retrotransposon Copia-like N-terminal domain-containing protein n=1 Tax=Sesamum angustifolium TaxID=2727405 RepID=A0AAW2J5Q9_9LAMI
MSVLTSDGSQTEENLNQANSMDVTSSFYLHVSDNLGQIYVSELIHDGNYGEWVNDMSNALFAKNKIGFVNVTIQKPTATSLDLGHWMRKDVMVKKWLKSAMDKEIRSNIRYTKTARGIWEERFGKVNTPKAYELRHAIALLK